jgi:hypothetical protein
MDYIPCTIKDNNSICGNQVDSVKEKHVISKEYIQLFVVQ